MAYDAGRKVVVLFGGSDRFSGMNDTWTWDGTNWSKQHPATKPSRRYLAAMTFDGATRGIVLFGGATGCCTFAGDTWSWDGTNWIQRFSPASPDSRASAMVSDRDPRAGVLFGGIDDVAPINLLDDTWVWNGASWHEQKLGVHPQARDFQGMAADRSTVLIFGGAGTEGSLGDTWAWTGRAWRQLVTSNSPSSRVGPGMVFDQATGQFVLFGGANGLSYFSDTWVLGPSS
jgi:hypothetical protein